MMVAVQEFVSQVGPLIQRRPAFGQLVQVFLSVLREPADAKSVELAQVLSGGLLSHRCRRLTFDDAENVVFAVPSWLDLLATQESSTMVLVNRTKNKTAHQPQ